MFFTSTASGGNARFPSDRQGPTHRQSPRARGGCSPCQLRRWTPKLLCRLRRRTPKVSCRLRRRTPKVSCQPCCSGARDLRHCLRVTALTSVWHDRVRGGLGNAGPLALTLVELSGPLLPTLDELPPLSRMVLHEPLSHHAFANVEEHEPLLHSPAVHLGCLP